MSYEPIKEETKDLYLKIWTHYSIGHFTQEQLAKLFGCSTDTILNAIKWGAANRTIFEPDILIEAAKEAVEAKLRDLSNDILTVKGKEFINWNAAIGIEKIIFTYREILWKLQGILYDKNIVGIVAAVSELPYLTPSLRELLGNLTKESKALNITQEERNIIADVLERRAKSAS